MNEDVSVEPAIRTTSVPFELKIQSYAPSFLNVIFPPVFKLCIKIFPPFLFSNYKFPISSLARIPLVVSFFKYIVSNTPGVEELL